MQIPPYLAMYLELLHARHSGFSCNTRFAIICQERALEYLGIQELT